MCGKGEGADGTTGNEQIFGMGWIPDYPDFRDFTIGQDKVSSKFKGLGQKDSIKEMFKKAGVLKTISAGDLPQSVDLRQWCSPIENQGSLGSCTANAAVGMVEYYERKAFGKHIDASRLFLYKTSRNILKWKGDTGVYLRTTMGALALFGTPPEEYWPYDLKSFDVEPTAFCYAFADNFKAIQYVRLDPIGTLRDTLLSTIKTNLAASIPSIFGFTVYKSIDQANVGGKIPYACSGDSTKGGHAMMTVGYDNNMVIKNSVCGFQTVGAFLVRNSWGTGWGDKGYGWLPYDYVLKGLAVDWWTLLKNDWIDTGQFQI